MRATRIFAPGRRAAIILSLLLIGLTLPAAVTASVQRPNTVNIRIAGLLGLTGDAASAGFGKATKVAMELAADNLNKSLIASGSRYRVRLAFADTKFSPEITLAQMKRLAGKGIRLFVGPQSSSAVKAVKEYADANGLIVMSTGSTSSALSIAGDNIYRLIPDDVGETAALDALLVAQGKTNIVPVYRDDLGNLGLRDSLTRIARARGATVSNGVKYPVAGLDGAATVAAIKAQLGAAPDPATTAVFLAAFDEGAQVLAAASADPYFQDGGAGADLLWYGSDGVIGSGAYLSNDAAVAFSKKVIYPNPNFTTDFATPLASRLEQQIRAATGFDPDGITLGAYDAVEVLARSVIRAGGPKATAKAIGRSIFVVTSTYVGANGRSILNRAGDRASAPYAFWRMCGTGADLTWKVVGGYKPASSPGRTSTITMGTCEAPTT